MTSPDPISLRLKVANQLLDLSRPPNGWAGASAKLTSSRLMGFGVALGFLLRAAVQSDEPFSPEDRRALLGQGLAAVCAEYLAQAPLELRGKLAATLMLMSLEGVETFESELTGEADHA